ncbi:MULTISPECIES: N-acetylmuramoyl-L-alanine amidase [Chelativorans]|jgi:N-acetylmuramoyl-L-alanine amidase|uniref:N-acetylmuramoyl-L-alanine amidase n=1 Tax=Chelativorans sp. (strain BNC1) TaxID=266779 RepID=Q11GR4_CHESB|nr:MULTISPECIES: N-acetylmuramoyl-L-alanine amidase [Chelativorans]
MTGFPPDFPEAAVRPSPNFGERRKGRKPDAIILHYTGMTSGQAAEDWLCNPTSEVSSHYLAHEDGRVVQMVPEAARAWHAGRGSWKGEDDVNSFSIGVEIVNPGHQFGYRDFPSVQIDAVAALCLDICRRNAILPQRVLAHSDTAPGRKVDPGEKFPWKRLAEMGVGHYVDPERVTGGEVLAPGDRGSAVAGLQRRLAEYGYGIEKTGVFDAETETVVAAFQRHFRPSAVNGIADSSTCSTLEKLILALPK